MNLFETRDTLLKRVAEDRKENTVFLDGIEEGINSTINFILEGLDNERKDAEAKTKAVEAPVGVEETTSSPAPRLEDAADAETPECTGPCGCGC